MYIYFVKTLAKEPLNILFNNEVSNFLTSFANKNESLKFLEIYKEKDIPKKQLIIDSGAFSVWKSGLTIDIHDYISFCKDVLNKYSKYMKIYVVNLDVIPGIWGKKPTMKERDLACKQGYENMHLLIKEGLTPIHVFHQHEDYEFLKQLSKEIDYIGISPANDQPQKSKVKFMDSCFSILKASIKTHGFAVTAEESLMRYPFYSVDSMSYNSIMAFGRTLHTDNIKYLHNRIPEHLYYCLEKEVQKILKLEKQATDLWKRRGVVWNS